MIESWLQHPGFQSAVAPLAVAVIVAAALARLRLSGLAVLAGALVCVHLSIGLQLFPLSATRRIVAVAILAGALGAVLDLVPALRRVPSLFVAGAGAAALVWVLHPALANRGVPGGLALGGGLALFCAVTAWGLDRLHARPVRAGSAALALGLAVGGCAVLGASASLGQIGLATGAAAGGFLLVQMIRGQTIAAGRALTAPAGLLASLLAAAAVVLARLPWHALPLLALVPLAASLPIASRGPVWVQAVVHGAVSFVVGLGAVAIAWQAAGSSSSSGY